MRYRVDESGRERLLGRFDRVGDRDAAGPDRRVIACNYVESTGVAALGALAYVQAYVGGNLPDRVRLLVRSRGGRWIEKWENMRRVDNFRLKTIPPEHPRYNDERIWSVGDAGVEYLDQLRYSRAWVAERQTKEEPAA